MSADLAPLMREMAQKAGAPINPYVALYAAKVKHLRALCATGNILSRGEWAEIEDEIVRLAVLANGWPLTEPVTP